jgi:glycine/D-amino acid oxidase-like deaminating enzyme
MKKSADVVVIGGGVIGTAVTYYLAQKGLDVCSIEKRGISDGTSSRCEGNVVVYDTLPGHDCKLAKSSLDMFPKLSNELSFDISWTQNGTLLLAESEEEFEIAKRHGRRMVTEEGLPYRAMDKYEIHDDEPLLSGDIVGGLEVGCDGSLNPMALAQGFSYAAKQNGAQVLTYTAVSDIKVDGRGQVGQVVTDRGNIATKCVVNAAGIWAPDIGKMVGLDIPIQPRQGHIIVGERAFPVARRAVSEFGYIMAKLGKSDYKRNVTPQMEQFGVALVLEPTEAQNFIFGSSRRFVGRDVSSNREVLQAIAQRAIRFFPAIRDINAIRSYVGCRPYTSDHAPIISGTEIPGFYIAAGHEGNGIGLAPITGELIANLVCDEATRINADPFGWSRFS